MKYIKLFFRTFFKEIRREWVEEKAWQDFLVAMGIGLLAGLVTWFLI